MDLNRVLDKIQKCLALSKSPNAHEAAAGLRQAQKLMQQYQIDEGTLALVDYHHINIDLPVQVSKALPMWLGWYMGMLKRCFAIEIAYRPVMRVSDYSYEMTLYGPRHRVLIAEYAHRAVWKAMMKAYTQFLKEYPSQKGLRGARTSFYIGFIYAVESTVQAIAPTADESKLTLAYMERDNGEPVPVGEASVLDLDKRLVRKGHDAADDFSLSIGVDANKPNNLQLEN